MFKSKEKIRGWSLSQLDLYNQCPEKYKYVRIDKKIEPKNKHLENGLKVHGLAEQFIKSEGEIEMPKELNKLRREMRALITHKATSEERFVLGNQWNYLGSDNDAWMSPEAWLRFVVDSRVENTLIDFKTGKEYSSHINQARLYANAYMCIDDKCDDVDVEFWYVNTGKVKSYTFVRTDLEQHKKEWEAKVAVMHADTEYLPKQNEYCKYCHFMDICSLYR